LYQIIIKLLINDIHGNDTCNKRQKTLHKSANLLVSDYQK